MTKHNRRNTLEYKVWLRIKTHCYNKKYPGYSTYGGRGIKMDKAWKESFSKFLIDVGYAPRGCVGLELINLNADYTKHNVKWVRPSQRRPLKEMPGQKNRKKWGKIKEPKRLTITIEDSYFNWLKKQALVKSLQTNTIITVPELIRDILNDHAPMPSQLEFFSKEISEKTRKKSS